MKKKTLLRGPDIDTKLIDGILRGNRSMKHIKNRAKNTCA